MTESEKEIIESIGLCVRERLTDAEPGHDWYHVMRVMNSARVIYPSITCNPFIIELGVLLHDIADPKFHNGNEEIGPEQSRLIMAEHNIEDDTQSHVVNIIKHMSFKNSIDGTAWTSVEMKVVQDADRLDAIGAIGIARAFTYGGHKGRIFFDPNIPPRENLTKSAYTKIASPTINHFYEKLLRLKDRMNTSKGKELAQERHNFLKVYLDQFYKEWYNKQIVDPFIL